MHDPEVSQPLLGQFDVRRLRFDITGKASVAPIELMRRTLKHGDVKLGARRRSFRWPCSLPRPTSHSGATRAMGA